MSVFDHPSLPTPPISNPALTAESLSSKASDAGSPPPAPTGIDPDDAICGLDTRAEADTAEMETDEPLFLPASQGARGPEGMDIDIDAEFEMMERAEGRQGEAERGAEPEAEVDTGMDERMELQRAVRELEAVSARQATPPDEAGDLRQIGSGSLAMASQAGPSQSRPRVNRAAVPSQDLESTEEARRRRMQAIMAASQAVMSQPEASSSRAPPTPPPDGEEDDLLSMPAPHFADGSSEPPCRLPGLSATMADGRQIAFRRRNRPQPPKVAGDEHRNPLSTHTSSLLGRPLYTLMREVEELKSRDEAVRLQRQLDEEQRRAFASLKAGPSKNSSMWVDKYRPRQFADLLGEDRVHREVMTWLKEWDKCVFRRTTNLKKRKMGAEDEANPYTDSLGRPRERILLLSGPPGYGKTTLAQICARQAGYKALEINASDDRNAATVSTRIKNAIDAGTGLMSEGRPTCVVIDEVDGAGGGEAGFIKSLIKLIQDVPARRKTNTPAKPLRRPIICICNDLYATSLRPLRPFARIIRFRKPQAQFLVKRLRDICDREALQADQRVLGGLVELTKGDVRSCLNTLQFIKARSTVVTDDLIRSSSVGLKDSGTTLNTVWTSLFVPVSAKVRRKTVGIEDGRYVDRLAFEVQACGEYDKLVQGLFEHYPGTKPIDASLGNLNKLHDWVRYYDRLIGRVEGELSFELMGYLPYAVVPWHTHLAAPANSLKPVEWPRADYEAYQARQVNLEISTALSATLPPVLRSLFASSSSLLVELVPLLMRIISPPLKPVNANIVKSAERQVLDRLVVLMLDLGLKFYMEKGENGQPMMRLEPPIDVFVHYEGKRAEDIAASRFAVRQLVDQAMDAEIARRKGQTDGADGATADSLKNMYGAAKKGKAHTELGKTETIATDFFGRTITKPSVPAAESLEPGVDSRGGSGSATPEPPALKRFRAVYKFHEGSSSAVRKSIKMSSLL